MVHEASRRGLYSASEAAVDAVSLAGRRRNRQGVVDDARVLLRLAATRGSGRAAAGVATSVAETLLKNAKQANHLRAW